MNNFQPKKVENWFANLKSWFLRPKIEEKVKNRVKKNRYKKV